MQYNLSILRACDAQELYVYLPRVDDAIQSTLISNMLGVILSKDAHLSIPHACDA